MFKSVFIFYVIQNTYVLMNLQSQKKSIYLNFIDGQTKFKKSYIKNVIKNKAKFVCI